MNSLKNSPHKALKEKGSALIISLVLLTAITLISITSLQRTNLQTRIVANIQHTESGFNIVSSELEEIFVTYNSGSATSDLTKALDTFTLNSEGKKSFGVSDTTVISTYKNKNINNTKSLQVSSNLIHKGQPLFTSGYSVGGFSTYKFEINADSSLPNGGYNLSSQSLGVELIGPTSI
ncbi:MAG: hypothetical protein KBT75_00755 [Oleispira antarctica]|uniref:Type 4 fimbrial biogenesis protein PilX N-terminal domain-containing protein n=1 Tax=Oleispira antarctica RB-8 TaxID=698738 RepID=R4YKG2_OLEAN|nr:hypothetical protein [Oleispira antarctica]MBQ0791187.1 hypothetical protein [Oleispira antarctica]CCK74765.1 hypothetical protein OLEAN_C05890 [Oleispira antarctica RB-8]